MVTYKYIFADSAVLYTIKPITDGERNIMESLHDKLVSFSKQ